MSDLPYYVDDPLVDRAAHRPSMDVAEVPSAVEGRTLYVGTCSCGDMTPTDPWDNYAVLEAYDLHMARVQQALHAARAGS